ncbi:MAG: dockerin type I repeat-containing protein [Clostridia bacterium]|nr:dockerin type I repeat-containing protein [Clostridia bacterium]
MTRKLLSLVLCLALLLTAVPFGSVATAEDAAAATDNLLTNGDFESHADGVPTNWEIRTTENTSSEIVEDVEIAEGVTKNAVKFTTTADAPTTRSEFFYTGKVEIEKNAKYTTTYWVKVKNVKGFRTYMYEPDYVALDGTNKHQDTAAEGQNIYTFSYDNGSTRVIRTDIKHNFTIAETGTAIDGGGPSMFISRANGVEQPLTPDYPATERQDEWFQIIHTFETGNDDAHKADVRYQFSIPEAVDGEVWIADMQMSVERNYVPAVNDDTLGTIAEGTKIPVNLGEEVTITAEPFALNSFLGWYEGDTLVSEEAELTFVYNGNATPTYEARFEANEDSVIYNFEEGYTNNQTLAQATASVGTEASGPYSAFLGTETNGSGFVVDSSYTGTWRKATITTNKYAHSGTYAVNFSGQYGSLGYKFSGLEQNKDYNVSVYAYLTHTVSADWAGVGNIIITPATASYLDTTARLANKSVRETDVTAGWKKLEIDFNSGDNTEVIFWVDSNGTNAYLYLDDFAVTPAAINYTPNVNDKALGYTNTVKTRVGAKTTVVATPLGEATFDGWYNGETLLSKDAKYTFVYSENAANYEARFISSGFGVDGSYETGYTNGQTLAQLQHTTGTVGGATSDWTPDLWKQSSLDGNNEYFMESNNSGNYRKATISNAYAYAGQYSLKFEGLFGMMGRKFTGLTANTDYIVSFYALVKDNAAAQVGGFRVTTADTAPVLADGHTIALENCIAGTYDYYGTLDEWEKVTYKFNSGNNTEVIFWMNHNNTGSIYIDNFVITRTANVTTQKSAYGTATSVGTVAYNEAVTVTATPYEGNTFEGWYIGEELVSEDATYTFNAAGDVVLTPEFSGTTYEHFALNGQDGTFENGSIDGIRFSDPNYGCEWCNYSIINTDAYEGNNALKVHARHRNTIIPLTNLDANTNYTLSFYFYINEIEAPAGDGSGTIKRAKLDGGITAADVEVLSGEVVAKADTILSTASWQKFELSFNSGNATELNLVLRFLRETDGKGLIIDNMELIHKDTVAPEIVAGDIDGTGEVDLSDVTALSRHLAGWTTDADGNALNVNEDALDVNADSAVNLKDLVLLAQYVAGWGVTLY